MFLTIRGEQHYLWRAVDQEGNVLDILVQRQRNKKTAKKFFRKLLKSLRYAPRVIITDKLRGYRAAKREILPSVEHRQHRYLNNRAENSTNRRASGNDACSGSSRPDTPSAFLRPMGLSPHTSDRGATGSRPQRTARRWVNDSRSGEKSWGWLLPHKCQEGCSGPPPGLVMVSKHVNLTMPGAHLLLQTRVKTLNRELGTVFQRWYPDLQLEEEPLAA